ncbi:Cullin binding-domain-containing protein [Scenedesmus sp. NREL 46B-D3]|nr:Cullin binding-domain-containing protein [Scenedesmus sp. NREL 46B-D3]
MHSIAQCPSPIHTAPGLRPTHGGHNPLHGASVEFDMLQQAYVEFASALGDPCGQSNKARLFQLSDQLQAQGVYGDNALHLLQRYGSQINWQGMSQEVFSSFYRFVYFICREPSKRNVQVSTAVAAWQLVLCGRFRLLERWCSYVSTHHKANVVLEDTWRQVLDFSRTVHEDLSNYDAASAWPVLLDDFVEHIKGSRRHRTPHLSLEPLDILSSPWAARTITAVSPRSGSKRRPPDVLAVADQLQQLPLAEAGSAGGGTAAAGGMPTSPASQRTILTAKRVRFSGQEQQPDSRALGGSSRQEAGSDAAMQGRRSSDDAMQGDAMMVSGVAQQQQQVLGGVQVHAGTSRSGIAGGTWAPVLGSAAGIGVQLPSAVFPTGGGAGDISGIRSSGRRAVGAAAGARAPQFGQAAATSHGSQQQQAQQPQAGGSGPFSSSSTGAVGRPASASQAGPPGVQGAGMPAPAGLAFREAGLAHHSSMDVFMDAMSEQPSQQQQQQQQLSAAMPGQQQQQQQQQQMASHASLCPSGLHGHVRREAEMRRTSSVIAMMQVTVTEALGFN